MFDFLKNIKFKRPEEPQERRGTVIQTDDTGRIATMPTDDGRSRIISRDEYDRLNTMQGRRFAETPRQPSLDPREGQYAQQENIAMRNALQAQAQGIKSMDQSRGFAMSNIDDFNRFSSYSPVGVATTVKQSLGMPFGVPMRRRGDTGQEMTAFEFDNLRNKMVRDQNNKKIINIAQRIMEETGGELDANTAIKLAQDEFNNASQQSLVGDLLKFQLPFIKSNTPYRDEDYGAPLQPKDDPFSYFDQIGPDKSKGTMDSKVIDPPLNKKTEVTKYFEEQFGGDKKMAEDAYKSFFGQPHQ